MGYYSIVSLTWPYSTFVVQFSVTTVFKNGSKKVKEVLRFEKKLKGTVCSLFFL